MTEQLLAKFADVPAATFVMALIAAIGLFVAVVAIAVGRRQRLAIARLEDRLTHLNAGLSLLTNTTEEGLRGVALEVSRLAGASEARPRAVTGARQRIASAAGHGRSVQDIAATEQVSEGEVLLHLLLDRLHTEGGNAEVC